MAKRFHKVLVTGAGGFIGSHVVEALVRGGYAVRAMLHYNARRDRGNLVHVATDVLAEAELVWSDVTDAGQMMRHVTGYDAVLHLAALIGIPYSYEAPASYMNVNAMGALHVLEACRSAGVGRVVLTSTSEVYGTARTARITEEHPLTAQSPYAASKIAADQLGEAYWRSFETPVVVLRPFNAFGPRQSMRAVLPTIIGQALSGAEAIELGSLWPERDWTFVADTARAFVLALEADAVEGETIHVGTGRATSVGELAALCIERIGSHGKIACRACRARPEASEVGRLQCDASKAGRLLGWSAGTSLETGLDATIEFYREAAARQKARPPGGSARVAEYVV